MLAAGTTPVCKSKGRCLVFCMLLLTWSEASLQSTSVLDKAVCKINEISRDNWNDLRIRALGTMISKF